LIRGKKVISSDLLKEFGKMSEERFWIRFKQKYGAEEFATFSTPLFSKDNSTAILTINYYTKSGGGGETIIFHNRGGKWENLKMLDFWDN
jgi:hypothetical protein